MATDVDERNSVRPIQVSERVIKYSRYCLMKNRYRCNLSDTSTIARLRELKLYKYRSRRAGRKTRRKIVTRNTKRKENKQLNDDRQCVRIYVKAVSHHQRPNPPKLFLTNPQSLTNVYEEFLARILINQPDIIAVSETWFSINKPAHLFGVTNYEMLHKDRSPRVGGGVALFIRDTFIVRPVNIQVPELLECVWALVDFNYSRHIKKLLVCCIYHPPQAPSHDDLLEHLITTVDTMRASQADMRVIIMGDCNDLNRNYLCNELQLRCIVTEATHQHSVLDIIMTDAEFYSNCQLQPPIGLSKHKCVATSPDPRPGPPPHHTRIFRPLRDSSVRDFGQWIVPYEWREILMSQDTDEATECFIGLLGDRYERNFPEKRQRMREDNKPWITARILKLMDQRRKAYDRGQMVLWRELYFRTKEEVKKAKSETAMLIERNQVNSSKFSKQLRCVLGKHKKKLKIPFLSHLSDEEICKKICDHFTNICTFYPRLDICDLPAFLPVNDTPTVDRIQVYNELLKMNVNKASPPGSLPKRLIKEFAYEISLPLTHIFNLSLSASTYPYLWKNATISPHEKKKLLETLGDLRPLSLTDDFGKILEGFVATMILNDILPNIDPTQYGNLKGSSTSHYLIRLIDIILKGLEKPRHIAQLVLIDFKKAFDYVDHTVAIRELFLLGCRPSLLPFVISFLSGRRHRVCFNGVLSDWQDITCGVPQGTKLGPIIFLAIVNHVARNSDIRAKFVDDLTLGEIINTTDTIAFAMQDNLDKISEDCVYVKMSTNPLKCEVLMIFPRDKRNRRPLVYPDLRLNNFSLPFVTECKLLGVYLNSFLTWDTHIDFIVKKVNKCIFILYRARQFNFSRETMFTLYTWFIRTSLEYAAPVWHPGLTVRQHSILEGIQKRCFKIILGNNYLNYETALTTLNTSTLFSRRENLLLKFGSNMLKSERHRHLLPPYLHDLHGLNTRRGGHTMQPIRCRTARYQKSTIPYLVTLLNSQPL